MPEVKPLWDDTEPTIPSPQQTTTRKPKRRRRYCAEGPPTDIVVWVLQNEPENFDELMDLRRALYSRKTHGRYRIRLCGRTLAGEQKFTVTGRTGPLLILSDKSRHYLLRTLCRLRRKNRWPPIVYQ